MAVERNYALTHVNFPYFPKVCKTHLLEYLESYQTPLRRQRRPHSYPRVSKEALEYL
jgi:hypothetical protein